MKIKILTILAMFCLCASDALSAGLTVSTTGGIATNLTVYGTLTAPALSAALAGKVDVSNGNSTGQTLTKPKFPAVTNDFWVSTSGSDSNPGNVASPFATATNAIAAVPAGNASVIHFGPGTFDCGTNQLTMLSNMKLVGSGKFSTILLSSAFGATNPHHFILFPPMNGEIADLTVTNNQAAYCVLGGGDDGHVNSFTNTIIRNTAWFGYSDIFAAEGNNGPSSMDVYDSYLYTYEDVAINGGTSGGGGDPRGSTNNVMHFHNCDITSNPFNATSQPNGLSSAVGLVWAEGCNIHPIKTNGTVYAIGIVTTGLGYGRLDNCLLAESGTNADSDFHCVKTPKGPYLIINNCRRADGGALNGNGYFYDGSGVQVSGTNSVSYGSGYTNAANNAVSIGVPSACLTISNGVIAGIGVFTGSGGGMTNTSDLTVGGTNNLASRKEVAQIAAGVGGSGGSVPNGLVTNNADADIVVSHLGNSTTIYASSPPSIETGAGMFHTSLTVSNAGVAGTFVASTVGTNAAITLTGTTNGAAAKSLLIVDNVQVSGLTVNGNAAATTNQLTPASTTSPITTNQYAFFPGDNGTNAVGSTIDGKWWTNMTYTLVHLAPTANATNYTVDFKGADKQYFESANTNAHFTFSNIVTNRQVDVFVYATTSAVPCVVDFPLHVLHNNGWNLVVTNGQMQTYHLEAHKGVDPTNVVVTGGDYYHRD